MIPAARVPGGDERDRRRRRRRRASTSSTARTRLPVARRGRAAAHVRHCSLRAFRSLLLPLKAVLLNLLSIGATYGMLVVVFKLGRRRGRSACYQFDQVEGWIPIFLFAMLFGLSMDYEVFLVTRMREAWDEGPTTRTRSPPGSSAPAGS